MPHPSISPLAVPGPVTLRAESRASCLAGSAHHEVSVVIDAATGHYLMTCEPIIIGVSSVVHGGGASTEPVAGRRACAQLCPNSAMADQPSGTSTLMMRGGAAMTVGSQVMNSLKWSVCTWRSPAARDANPSTRTKVSGVSMLWKHSNSGPLAPLGLRPYSV